ncbi:MAG: ABC transporter ATP-binding protein [Acidobacteria bacterium]|jgi:ATP-binding cassette subfamily B protein|nr:ABC transporter ATP-binding protein [Acidobacteriota bacterium]
MTAPTASRGHRTAIGSDTTPPTWRDRVRALGYLRGLVRLVWETHRGYALAMGLLRIVRGLVPIAALWVGKLIIDGVIAAQQSGSGWDSILPLVLLEVAIVVAGDLLSRASMVVDGLLSDLFTIRISVRLMEHAATLDLAKFEDPTLYDHLERARRQTIGRIGLLSNLLGVGQSFITLLTLSAALLAFNPWLVVLLVVAILPGFLAETRFAALQYSLMFRWTQPRRQLDYLRYVGASDATAKEVQLFGLAPWLVGRFQRLSQMWFRENRQLGIRRAGVSAALSLVSTAGYYAAYLIIISQTVAGAITVGSLTFLAASFARGRDLVQSLLSTATSIYEESLYLHDLFAFFEMKPTIASKPGAPPVPTPIREGFVFEDVGFQYAGSDRWAVRHVNLTIGPGERIALVGENGAGKTTLAKLLARLYEPTEGRILLDGIDVRDYDLASLRRAIGVIFQDFVRYDFRFDENIGVGAIDETAPYLDAERPSDGDRAVPQVIRDAADNALASSLLPRLPGRWGQMLGRRFDGGLELSGGEWQKIALARAYARDAQALILDEPTAALDARAEYDVFLRFSELMAGRTAVIISHRFSTVRMADRIVVLRQGEVLEVGTHDVLVAAGGLYAELFGMQAQGYR